MAILLDGMALHWQEDIKCRHRVVNVGRKQGIDETDQGTFDWSKNKPLQNLKHNLLRFSIFKIGRVFALHMPH